MRELVEAGVHVDAVVLLDELSRRGELEAAGGPVYIAALLDGTPGECVKHYAPILKRLGRKRHLALAFAELSDLALDPTVDPDEVIGRAAQVVGR